MTFDEAVEFVLEHEGEYSDDPADTGGRTKFGISQRAYPDLDIPNLARGEAVEILRRDYWEKCRCSELPAGLDLLVFDAAVNQGPGAAARMLQKVLRVAQDGIVGAITIRAAHSFDANVRQEFIARRAYQYALVPQVMRMGLGWYRRLADAAAMAFTSQ
jgi:lysozyme family protein